jgi:hypothetical protein
VKSVRTVLVRCTVNIVWRPRERLGQPVRLAAIQDIPWRDLAEIRQRPCR